MKTCPGNPTGMACGKPRSHSDHIIRRALEVPSEPLEEIHVHENVPWKSLRGWLEEIHVYEYSRAYSHSINKMRRRNPQDGFGVSVPRNILGWAVVNTL